MQKEKEKFGRIFWGRQWLKEGYFAIDDEDDILKKNISDITNIIYVTYFDTIIQKMTHLANCLMQEITLGFSYRSTVENVLK